MNVRLSIAVIVVGVAFSVFMLTSPDDPIPIPAPLHGPGQSPVEVLAEGLDRPRSIAIHDDTVYVAERGGTIRMVSDGTLLERPFATLDVTEDFDAGLLGIALDPDYASNGWLYAMHTYEEDGELWNRLVRLDDTGNHTVSQTTIFDGIPANAFSNGGRIQFGPDGKIYAGTGSSMGSHEPQDTASLSGKVLRLNPDGTIPDDNPLEGSPVYSYGYRNPQGMAWDDTGRMYLIDLGPEKNDEINLVLPGRNYGWPEQECSGDRFEDALVCYDPSIEPGGIIYYAGDAVSLDSPFVMASLRTGILYQIVPEDGLQSQNPVFSGVGRIRDVAQDADGNLYVLTSNTDGKGFPKSGDDKLLRIVR